MRYFLFILLVGLLSACSSDDESNVGATAAKMEVSKNEVKLSNVDGSFTINVTATSTWTARSDLDRRLVDYIKKLRRGEW